jgi:hypothetical protein
MATKPKRRGRSLADDRELFEMAKKLGLNAIVRRTGRKPESIMRTAKRIGAAIKGRPMRKSRQPDAV